MGVKELYSSTRIAERIRWIGKAISQDYSGRALTLIPILKGSFVFASDLIRTIELPDVSIDFLGVSSYGAGTSSTGVVRITQDLAHSIHGKHIVIVEDIIDTGLTLQHLLELLATREPASVSVCTLLHKPARTRAHVKIDYLGFEIEDKFVVGYGLDYQEKYRNLPFIGELAT
jgi:hypoxanthine phosphoribosyltransferase